VPLDDRRTMTRRYSRKQRMQSEVGHNFRWDSDKIMRRAAINDKRNYHFSMVRSFIILLLQAFGLFCAMEGYSRRLKSLLLQFGPPKCQLIIDD
jgi:hypothetical protein